MKQLTIVVKPFRAEAVLRVVAELGVTACAVREARATAGRRAISIAIAARSTAPRICPRSKSRVWVDDEQAAELADHVPPAARTGRIGDGKVFVVPLAWPEPLEF